MQFQKSIVFRNFLFLFANQFFNLIIPLLVFPFLLKILGLELFGLYSLSYSGIIFCFMFCDYGFNFSGSKYIALNKQDILKRDTAFSTIISLKIIIAIIIAAFWIFFVLNNARFHNHIYFGMAFIGMIIGNAINPQWFFQGIEKLGWFSTVNSIIKLISNISILFIIKTSKDIYLIPLIYSFAFLITGIVTIVMAIYIEKVTFKFFSFHSYRLFLKDGLDYFVTISTTSLVFNGTIIILSFFEKSILIIGAFSALDRIIKILVSIYVPYSTVIYPRNMANFQISNDRGKQSVIKYGAIALILATLIILIICIFAKTILTFLNTDLVPYCNWLRLFSTWLFFIIMNNLIGYHYLNGLNKSSLFRNINIIYTIVTVALMILGSYLYSFKGCIFAVLFGEILLMTMLLYNTNSEKTIITEG